MSHVAFMENHQIPIWSKIETVDVWYLYPALNGAIYITQNWIHCTTLPVKIWIDCQISMDMMPQQQSVKDNDSTFIW